MTSPETPSGLATSSGTQAGALRPTLRRPLMTMLLLSIAAGLLAPIWTVRYPPLVDYPFHLATAFVLAHIKDPVFHFHEFYASDWNTQPYLAMYAVLVGLQRIASIYVAGRLLLSLCVLSVPAGGMVLSPSSQPRRGKPRILVAADFSQPLLFSVRLPEFPTRLRPQPFDSGRVVALSRTSPLAHMVPAAGADNGPLLYSLAGLWNCRLRRDSLLLVVPAPHPRHVVFVGFVCPWGCSFIFMLWWG